MRFGTRTPRGITTRWPVHLTTAVKASKVAPSDPRGHLLDPREAALCRRVIPNWEKLDAAREEIIPGLALAAPAERYAREPAAE